MREIWREIPDFPDYRISNLGQVKSLKFGKERILKPGKDRHGHLMVVLSRESKRKTCYIHKLLGVVFLGFPENKEVDHINGNPSDNRLENLRPCTRQENNRNIKIRSNNTTGYPGVSFFKPTGEHRAYIKINDKFKHLGLFKTPEEAFIAYRDANLALFDEFSPFNCRDDLKALAARAEAALEGGV